jgi:hypothetical protein
MKTNGIAMLAFGVMMFSSCATEKLTYADGKTIEWKQKSTSALTEVGQVDQQIVAANVEQTAVSDELVSEGSKTAPTVTEAPVWTAPAVEHHPSKRAERMQLSTEVKEQIMAEVKLNDTAERSAPEGAVPAAAPVAAPGGGGKNQTLAAVLAFFLGGLGIHRFYLGYTWQGVVQLLTAGGFFIWALIDFIRICIGDLEPKDGSYD